MPGLVPDEVALGHQTDSLRPSGEVRAGEHVAAVLVGVADDDAGVPARSQDPSALAEDRLHPLEEGRVVGAVREVRRVVADHRVVGPAVGMGDGEGPAGHRQRQLDVVRRIGRHEVDRHVGQTGQEGHGVAASATRDPPGRTTGRRRGRSSPGRRAADRSPPARPRASVTTAPKIATQRGSSSMPTARRGPCAIAAPRSVPPTPAKGSSTSSPLRVKNSISRP